MFTNQIKFQYPQSGISPLQRTGMASEMNAGRSFSTLSRVLVLCNDQCQAQATARASGFSTLSRVLVLCNKVKNIETMRDVWMFQYPQSGISPLQRRAT